MKFDNKNFEQNVQKTMSSLESLKEKLKLKDSANEASKGIANIASMFNKIHFTRMTSALNSIIDRFGALDVIGVTALTNITNSAVNAGKQLVKSLSIDQITAGMQKYEQKTSSVQTIMNATGMSIDEVNGVLDQLMWFSDETSYSFTDMTAALAQMTSSGGDVKKLIPLITGIANATAFAGKGATQFSSAMYNLNQSYSKGYLDYTDWKSIDLMGISSKQLKQTIIDTAVAMKKIKKGEVTLDNFANTLSDKWADRDVMEAAFGRFSELSQAAYEAVQAGEYDTASEAIEALSEKYDDLSVKAFRSAQEAKSFTEAIDATKDAVSSGWMRTFEIIFGNYDEAKVLWTDLANALWDAFASGAEARNEMLDEWKNLGGRDKLVEAFWNAWEGVGSIIKPIKEAFRDIFPPMTAERLMKFTDKLHELASRIKISEDTAKKLKSTFKGVFSVFDVGITLIGKFAKGAMKLLSNFTGIIGCILNGSSTLGDWLSKTRDSIKESNLFGRAIDTVVNFLQNGIDKLKEFGSELKEGFAAKGYKGFVGFLKAVWEFLYKIGGAAAKAFGSIGETIAKMFGQESLMDVFSTGGFAALLVGLYKFLTGLSKPLDSLGEMFDSIAGEDGIIGNIIGILDGVRGCFEAYQSKLKSEALLKIASAIGILAASLFVISTIDEEALGRALGGISGLFIELLGAMALFSKIPSLKGTMRAIPLMLGMSTSLLILSAALKVMGSMELTEMGIGLLGLASGLGAFIGALHLMPKEKDFGKSAKVIRSMSISLLILSAALKVMGSMELTEMGIGLLGVVGGLGAMVGALRLMPKDMASRTKGMIGLSTSLVIMAGAIKLLGSMKLEELGKGVGGLVVGLGAVVGIMKSIPKDVSLRAGSMIGLATALVIFGGALKLIGSMSLEELGKGLGGIVVGLVAISKAMKAMPQNGVLSAGVLLAISTALISLGVALRLMGSMKLESIGKALLGIVGTLAVLGLAARILAPLSPVLMSLAGAFALFGVGAIAFGAGITLIATGLGILGAVLGASASAIVAGLAVLLNGVINLIPTILEVVSKAILGFCKVIADTAPAIVDAIFKLLAEVLKSLATYTPIIANSLFDFLIGLLDVLSERTPELIASAVKFIKTFFVGVGEALTGLDGGNLLKGAFAVAIMTAFVKPLSSVSALLGPAMKGLLGIGVLVAELSLVLAAVGALAQIPGLSWLISEGGNFLEKVGTAIGQFIGGIVGGIAQGFTNSLPDIAEDLSDFMEKIQPFVKGASNIDPSISTNVGNLVKAVLAMTGAGFVTKIADFLTIGKDPLTKFGEQLVPFGESMKAYSDVIAGVDSAAINASANAANALAALSEAMPKTGGLFSLFTGSNDLSSFAKQLVPFGEGLKEYSLAVAGINDQAIIGSANAAKAIADMANIVPNTGGMVAWFTGDNSLANFKDEMISLGEGLAEFSNTTSEIVPENIIGTVNAAKALAEMLAIIPNEGGVVSWFAGDNSVAKFGKDLVKLGEGLRDFSIATANVVPDSIVAAANAARSLAEMTSIIPNEGGMVAWFTGDNSVSKFATNLVKLGEGLKGFSESTIGIIPTTIVAAANAAKSLAEMASVIPNEGGMVAWFKGENSVAKFASYLPDLGDGLKGFSDSVTGINAENVTAAANAAKSLAQMVSIIPTEGGIKAWFTGETAVSKFANKLPDLGTGLKGFSDAVTGIVPENVTAAANAAKALAEMADTTPKNTDKIVKFGENLGSFGTKLKAYFENTAGITSEAITISSNAVTSLKTAMSGINADAISAASKAIDNIVKSLKNMSKISESSIKGFTKSMKKLGEVNVDSIIKAFDNADTKLENVGKNTITSVIKGIEGQESKIKTAGSDTVEQFGKGLTAKNETLDSSCKKLVSNCADKIKSHKSLFYNAGSHLVSGFSNGISANAYKAVAQAKAMADAAEEAARKALGINSPSKVFREIGSGIPEGFSEGIGMFGTSIKKSVGVMGNTAISNMQSVIARVLDTINTDIDSQPTIRPVLDLSDIQSGASTIGSMFDRVGIGANLNAISSSMNSRIQNGVNNDVVSAINKLRNELGNVGGDTYNINGVSVDDDTNIRDAVQTIIRAATRERRV